MGKAIDVATDIYGDLVAFKDYPQGITKTFVDLKKDVCILCTAHNCKGLKITARGRSPLPIKHL